MKTEQQPVRPAPEKRIGRLRRLPAFRDLVREHAVSARQLVLPVFVSDADPAKSEVPSMPGTFRWPVESLADVLHEVDEAEIGGVLLFGIPSGKDSGGSGASARDGVVQRAVAVIRELGYDGLVITDVCLCEYTDHGHCGIVDSSGNIQNDVTLQRLADIAVSHAEVGCDVVAPSAMMDGQVAAIRSALDQAGFWNTGILSYSAKYASAFYGPFRDAADGVPQFGDRRAHQMDPANAREAMREHAADVDEGADMLMVKPGLAYLDMVRRTREAFPQYPLAVYNVSGEYSMVKAAGMQGWIDERAIVLEMLTGFCRAGADVIITYHALDAASWLRTG